MKKLLCRMKKTYNLAITSTTEYILTLSGRSASTILNIVMALLYGDLVNKVAAGLTFNELTPSLIIASIVTIANIAISWLCYYYGDLAFHHNLTALRDRYMSKLLQSRYLLIASSDSSKYVNHLSNDVSRIIDTYYWDTQYFIISVVRIIGTFGAALFLDWRIALSMVGFTLIMGILPLIIKKKLDNAMVKSSKANESYLGAIKENLLGITVIKNNCAEEVCASEVKRHNKNLFHARKKEAAINSVASGAGMGIQTLAILSLIILTCYFVSVNQIEAGAILSIYSIGTMFYGSILSCSYVVTSLFSCKGLRDIVEEVMDRENEPQCAPINLENTIELKNITFKYRPEEVRKILNNVSMKFDLGGKYLIIGKSGSGKSTILKLLCKFYDDYDGEITIDGKNYTNVAENQINTLIAYCQQNGYLFNRSLKDNIDFSLTGKTDKLQQIIDTVCLNEFINTLPKGIDTVIDEEVNQVSGGEKLRINLARSLFRNSQVLLLDEVTSALDKKTSETVENNLLKINKTLINVCHKFNDDTLKLYDRIYIIENGCIVESGTLGELKNNEKFIEYRNLNKQLSAEEKR